MLKILLILAIALLPALLSLVLIRKAEAQAQERLRVAMAAIATYSSQRYALLPNHQEIREIGYLIGDFTCRFNV